jgi:hypothetical protein
MKYFNSGNSINSTNSQFEDNPENTSQLFDKIS